MRKNNRVKAGNLSGAKGVYAYYEVVGRNVERLAESLKRKGVALFKMRRKGADKILFAVKLADEQKLFAIIGDVWYNTFKIKRIKYGGQGYPLYFLFKNIGLAVGILIFLITAAAYNDYIFSFSFTGSGSVYERVINETLAQNGITRFSRFSAIDYGRIEDLILSSCDELTFVSCFKRGNRLIIDSAAAVKKAKLSGLATQLCSDVDGVIISIKTYRGTAVKSIGDEVKSGEVIVDGYATVKDVTVKVNVIATVTVLYAESYDVVAENEYAAIALCEEMCGRTSQKSEIKKQTENTDLYSVTLYFKKVITAG